MGSKIQSIRVPIQCGDCGKIAAYDIPPNTEAALKSALLECVPEGATRQQVLDNIERLFGGEG